MVDPTLPAASGDWLRVADHLQASLSDMGIESGIRQRLLDLVRKSELSNQQHLKWKSVKCEAGSFETPNSRKAFAVVCERRWGVPGDEAVDAARDSAEPRAAVIELLVQHQMPMSWQLMLMMYQGRQECLNLMHHQMSMLYHRLQS